MSGVAEAGLDQTEVLTQRGGSDTGNLGVNANYCCEEKSEVHTKG